MILKPARLMLAMVALVAAPAFAAPAAPADVAATVNGKVITNAKIDLMVKQVVAQGKQTDSPQLREAIKRDLVAREVLIQEADKQGFGIRPDVKAALENARQSIIITALLSDYLKKNPIKESDIKAEYDRMKSQMSDKDYRARHILVPTEEEAKAIIVKLKAGAKFEDLAKAQSKDSSAEKGGDLDFVNPGNYVPEFARALVALQKGGVTETPVRTQFGYHVIRLEDTRPTQVKIPTFEEQRQQIGEQLQQRAVQAYRTQLQAKAKIQ